MPPRIQETPSDSEEVDMQGDDGVYSEEEDQLEDDDDAMDEDAGAPSASARPPTLRIPKRTTGDASLAEMEDELASEEGDDYSEDVGGDTPPLSAKGKGKAPKIKLKLGSETAVNPAVERARAGGSRRSSTGTSSGGRARGKKRARDEEGDSDEDFSEDDSESSAPSLSRMTARQRAKEIGDPGEELHALPALAAKSKDKYAGMNETEISLKRAEDSRKRASQVNKRLEDEKQETINRLLKKQTGKKGGKRGTGGTATPANEDDSKATGTSTPALLPAAVRPPPIPIGYRHISSTKSGAFGYVLAVPTGKEAAFVTKVATGYPGPRPPLKTKRLVA